MVGRERGDLKGGDVLLAFPRNRSRQEMSLRATSGKCVSQWVLSRYDRLDRGCWGMWAIPFHWKPSCSLKNSRNAGSSFNCDNSFGVLSLLCVVAIDRLLSGGGVLPDCERHICDRSPSSCRSPLRILSELFEER